MHISFSLRILSLFGSVPCSAVVVLFIGNPFHKHIAILFLFRFVCYVSCRICEHTIRYNCCLFVCWFFGFWFCNYLSTTINVDDSQIQMKFPTYLNHRANRAGNKCVISNCIVRSLGKKTSHKHNRWVYVTQPCFTGCLAMLNRSPIIEHGSLVKVKLWTLHSKTESRLHQESQFWLDLNGYSHFSCDAMPRVQWMWVFIDRRGFAISAGIFTIEHPKFSTHICWLRLLQLGGCQMCFCAKYRVFCELKIGFFHSEWENTFDSFNFKMVKCFFMLKLM